MALLYPAKDIKTNTPLTKYYYAVITNTFILGKNTYVPRVNVAGAIPRNRAFP